MISKWDDYVHETDDNRGHLIYKVAIWMPDAAQYQTPLRVDIARKTGMWGAFARRIQDLSGGYTYTNRQSALARARHLFPIEGMTMIARHKPMYVATAGAAGARRLVCIGRGRFMVAQYATSAVSDTDAEPLSITSYTDTVHAMRSSGQQALAEQITRLRERVVTWQDIITPENDQ